ncbi:unnamed protein product, partial [Effrenium voratum]
MSFQAARHVSSLLLPQQSSEDLVAQGLAAREARRRTVVRNWLAARATNLIWMLMLSAIMMPITISLLLLSTLFTAKICDAFSGNDAAGVIGGFLFGHFDDPCNQPIGALQVIFWVFLAIKMILFYIWSKCQDVAECDCENSRICGFLRQAGLYIILPPTVAFELVWPVATFCCLVMSSTSTCSAQLRSTAWMLLSPYFLQIGLVIFSCLWPWLKPILYRTGLLKDPANRVRDFTRVNFSAEAFNDSDGGYPTNCPICLADFAAGDQIVVTPCTGQKHVFHRPCLANWFRSQQTCPLCRTALGDSLPETL